jgi:hypothetical protein
MKIRLLGAALAVAAMTAMSASAQDAAAMPAAAAPASDAAGGATGTVIFFREKKFTGAAIRYKVRENGVELCKLKNGSFCMVSVPVGKHEYVVHSEAKDVLTLEVESGETYYVVGGISMGFMAGRPNLSPSDKATFDGMKPKLADNTGKDLGGGDDQDEKEKK